MADPEQSNPPASVPEQPPADAAKPKEKSGCMQALGCFGGVMDFLSCLSIFGMFTIGVGISVWYFV